MINGNRESDELPNWNGSKGLSQPLSLGTNSQPLKILVVDDNPINTKVIIRMVQKLGAHIVSATARNGFEAIERMRETPFDLVLMDIHMPGMTGVEAIKQIRSGTAGVIDSKLPIFAVSTDTHLQQERGYLAVGFNDFIEKPVNMDILHSSIVTALTGRFPGYSQHPSPFTIKTSR